MSTFLATRQAMGTRFELALVGADPAQLRAAAEEALDEIEWLDRRWSAFRLDSEVSGLNRSAARDAVRIEPRLMSLLDRARTLASETAGRWIRPSAHSWPPGGSAVGHRAFPPMKHLPGHGPAPASTNCGWILAKAPFVTWRRGCNWTWGPSAKAPHWTRRSTSARRRGWQAGLLHAGTSTIRRLWRAFTRNGVARGDPQAGSGPGRVPSGGPETRHPRPRSLGGGVLQDQALAISAVWGRTMIHSGISYGHVLDPRTGRPVDQTLMAAVLAPSGFEADAFSTALLVGGESLQARLAKSRPAWRSLLVARDPDDQPRLVNCGLL
jgi:FAD:protein FMN transferase